MNDKVKVTLGAPGVSEAMLVRPAETHTCTDKRGRIFTLKKPTWLQQFKFVDMLGGPTATNQQYMAMVLPVQYLAAIDGVDQPFPTTRLQVDALIQLLDETGFEAIGLKMVEVWGEKPPSTSEDIAAIKK